MKTFKKSLSPREPLKKTRVLSFLFVVIVVLLGYSVAARSADETAVSADATATESESSPAPAAPGASAPEPAPADLNANGATTEIGPVTEGDTGTGTAPETVTEAEALQQAGNEGDAYQPDNTGVNERDRSGDTLTPVDQSEAPQDVDITQEIRKAVMNDGALSFTAKNVKIITLDGAVTLRGPVKTAEEKDAIDRHARTASGVSNVDNQIEVSAEESPSTGPDTEQF